MFKRMPLSNRPRNQIIGDPVLMGTTLDHKTWSSIPNVSEFQHGQRTPVTTPEPVEQSNESSKGLPPLPFDVFKPLTPNPNRPVSDIPTASSVYSQPSPDHRRIQNRDTMGRSPMPNYGEVSPPSSPDIDAGQSHPFGGSRSVSPIEELVNPKASVMEAKQDDQRARYISNIPVLRRAKRRGDDISTSPRLHNAATGLRAKVDVQSGPTSVTKWDTFSGEPTTSERGKPGLIHTPDAEVNFPAGSPISPVQASNVSPGLGVAKPNFAERALKSGLQGLGINALKTKEQGQDASGRQSMVSHIAEKPLPETRPILLPRRSSKRISSSESSGRTTPAPLARGRPMGPLNSSPVEDDAEDIKPVVPLKAGRNTPPRQLTSPASSRQVSLTPGDPRSPATIIAPRGNEEEESAREHQNTSHASGESWIETDTVDEHLGAATKVADLPEEPPSRFSFTTYATGTTHDTPPRSPAHSAVSTSSSPARPSSDRRRAAPSSSGANVKATTRKPAPSILSAQEVGTKASKNLPQSPPELQSVDLISSLEAKSEDLRHRRGNVQRIIKDLEKVTLSTTVTYSSTYRAQAVKRMERYNEELADIIKEDHEIGLRLHRAWRRKDYRDCREPSAMWVRRVTG
ncbi:MAG: hypothetical protein M1825_005361 [Sarcosagium campestre]|nr:MAG: hypothetical protein M1825_005361 [Sarcosagium campestre]